MRAITVKLRGLGIKSPAGNECWHKKAIHTILSQRAYTGKAEFWGYELNQPEIISLSDFEKVQLKLQRNKELGKRNAKHDYLLSGYIYCSECGRRYIGSVNHGTRYYHCPQSSWKQSLNPCGGKSQRAESIETMVWLEIDGVF